MGESWGGAVGMANSLGVGLFRKVGSCVVQTETRDTEGTGNLYKRNICVYLHKKTAVPVACILSNTIL